MTIKSNHTENNMKSGSHFFKHNFLLAAMPLRGCMVAFFLCLVSIMLPVAAQADLLDDVQKRGYIRCGVGNGLTGFSEEARDGTFSGIDVDFCRAVAAAVFDNADAVEYTKLNAVERFEALVDRKIDILARNTTWTLTRDASFGEFVGVTFYDGQGFMVRRELGVFSAQELDGSKICVTEGTTTELNAVDYFKLNRVSVRLLKYENDVDVVLAYDARECDVYTADRSALAAQRGKLSDPLAHVVLPEIISKEPLGPVVPHGEKRWGDIARWTRNCMINAEELGVTRRNANRMSNSKVPSIRRLLGLEGETGDRLGLSNTWCYNVIALVGNYAEAYERNVGENTPLKLKRGVNHLWTNGGILYAPPLR